MEIELADWEKGVFEVPEITSEHQDALDKMTAAIHSARTKEQVVAAYAVRSELLNQFPNDVTLLKAGSYLMRQWQRLGGADDELAACLLPKTSVPQEKRAA